MTSSSMTCIFQKRCPRTHITQQCRTFCCSTCVRCASCQSGADSDGCGQATWAAVTARGMTDLEKDTFPIRVTADSWLCLKWRGKGRLIVTWSLGGAGRRAHAWPSQEEQVCLSSQPLGTQEPSSQCQTDGRSAQRLPVSRCAPGSRDFVYCFPRLWILTCLQEFAVCY